MAMLTVMSYDRYVAICHTLCYEIIMTVNTRVHGISAIRISGVISGLMHTSATFSSHVCGANVIHQFFCDVPHHRLLKFACSNEYVSELGATGFLSLVAFLCFISTGSSYTHIFSTVLRIPSAEGRAKAFSTHRPHLAVVILFICTGVFEFRKPHSDSPIALDFLLASFYTVLPPALNLMIYSLRNKAVKAALKKVFERRKTYVFC
ncbi:olfactory receptor 14J1-like [Hippopotamus amphibius kiboko]|uniref:olfactory receptor 14J1-like n=1 Tax=Hippopotamus amphibius kiboko TaxID=575201 RepID=UPI002599CF0B|nr:olfactory receptor 14J1-like [Hippopotamus amphibius kiboko]